MQKYRQSQYYNNRIYRNTIDRFAALQFKLKASYFSDKANQMLSSSHSKPQKPRPKHWKTLSG